MQTGSRAFSLCSWLITLLQNHIHSEESLKPSFGEHTTRHSEMKTRYRSQQNPQNLSSWRRAEIDLRRTCLALLWLCWTNSSLSTSATDNITH